MARAFSDRERRMVEKSLMDTGSEHIGRVGFSKTSVEDITRSAGVAKGTFYAFWPSKEEFFFACLERAEQQFQTEVVAPILGSDSHPADALGRLLDEVFAAMENYPIISQAMNPDLIQHLSRRIPPERLESHRAEDRLEFSEIVSSWNKDEFDPGISPEVFDGLFKGLMMMRLHRNIIGEDVFPDVVRILSRILSEGLKAVSEKRKHPEDASFPEHQS
ncbi:MAG: TetR/AcrR family transcriptional regulator [Spirochaetaceae bacterium]|nr:TetR/AcrR family transcriptional regulator [Spirochaetaceae bacterium]MDT8298136.1 TetR/AcrR family transcriptional regulator [Spirochaetaceae bacterium]